MISYTDSDGEWGQVTFATFSEKMWLVARGSLGDHQFGSPTCAVNIDPRCVVQQNSLQSSPAPMSKPSK